MKKKKGNSDKAVIEGLKNKLASCEEEKKWLQESITKLKNKDVAQKIPTSTKQKVSPPAMFKVNEDTAVKPKEEIVIEASPLKVIQSDDLFTQISKCILFAQLIGLKKKLTPNQLKDPRIIQAFEAKELEIHQGILNDRKK